MNSFQLLLANVFLAGLLILAIPITSITIATIAHRPYTAQHLVLRVIGMSASMGLLLLAGKTIVDVQTINRICAGVGDPYVMWCAGHGFVPHEVGAQLTQAKLTRDLLHCLILPVVIGVPSFLAVFWLLFVNRSDRGKQSPT